MSLTGFTFEQHEGYLKFINKTELNLIISFIPKPPKRKYIDVLLVKGETFHIIDDPHSIYDVKNFSFKLVDP